MRRTALVVLAVCALAAVAVPTGSGAERMWVGFHDDPSFRWVPNRADRIQSSSSEGSTIMRLLVQWNLAAPTRPGNASNPFDPAYKFDDVDEALRTAQETDMEVMLTISGTPRWANGGRAPNVMPRRLADFTNFARAISTRYSGRFSGYPFVRFWSVWNEPNLGQFLTPQFSGTGKSVAPANYARLYAAAYAGLKAGNRLAQVAIGETSARGSDRPTGIRPTHSPGKFAELVAKANPRLRFDAWSHHPYPFNPNSPPTQVVKWPNVSLRSLPRFHESLQKWFRQPGANIWITEYGHQTKPPDAFGVTYQRQAAYVRQSMALVRNLPYVGMFIWFVYQDDQGQPWDSGLYTRTGAPKGSSPSRFAATARPLDARNAVYRFRGGTLTPLVTLFVRRYCVGDTLGTPIGMTWRVFRAGRLVAVGQQTSPLRVDCTITARLQNFRVAKGQTYTATFDLNSPGGGGVLLKRQLTIRGV